jgi:hypothetical protein
VLRRIFMQETAEAKSKKVKSLESADQAFSQAWDALEEARHNIRDFEYSATEGAEKVLAETWYYVLTELMEAIERIRVEVRKYASYLKYEE